MNNAITTTSRPGRSRLRRVGTTLAATGLAGIALTVAAPGAHAVGGSADYSCASPLGAYTVPVSASSAALPASVPTGYSVPAGLIPVQVDVTIPASLVGTLQYFGIGAIGGSSDDFALGLGSASVPINGIDVPAQSLTAGQDMVLSSAATVGSFVTPKPGNLPITLPASFDLDAVSATAPLATLTCTLVDPGTATIGHVQVTKLTSSVSAKPASKTVSHTKHGKLAVKVLRSNGQAATGKVVAKQGTKTVGTSTLKNGKATMTLAKLKKGTARLTVTYLGDAIASGSQGNVTLKVT